MNMGRALPLPPILAPQSTSTSTENNKSSTSSSNSPIGVRRTRTEQFQSETGRAIDNLVTSSPLFYTTSLTSKYHEQLGSPSILKPNFRDLTGCTRLTTSLTQPKRSFRALQSSRQESDVRKPITMGKSSQQASCSSRNRERERILPPVPIRVNAKIRQIYSQITPSTTIPPPAVLSQMTQTETEYFLNPTTATISTSRVTESQIRQAEQEASSGGSNNNNISTVDACTSPINTPGTRKSSAYSLPPLSFTPNYISKLEDLEKITGHIIIQRFFTRTDDAFGSWIEKQLTLTNKTVGVDTMDFEEFDCSNNYRKASLSEDEKSEKLLSESEALVVQEEIKNDDGYVPKGICSPIEELPGEILSAEENMIGQEEIDEEHEILIHDPLQCSVDDCVQCECFKNEYENRDGAVIDPRSSTPIDKLDPIEEDIISQCVVLELKRALEKDSQELDAVVPEEPTEDLAETTIGSETLANDEEEIAVESLVEVDDKNEGCEPTENNAVENNENSNENAEISDIKCEEEIATEQAEDKNGEQNQDEGASNVEEKEITNSEEKIVEKEDLIVGSEKDAEQIDAEEKDPEQVEAEGKDAEQVDGEGNDEEKVDGEGKDAEQVDAEGKDAEQVEAETNRDELLEAEVSNSKVVDYLTELGELPTNDEIYDVELADKNGAVEGEASQIFAGVQLTEVDAGESVERDAESLVPRLKRSTSIDSCLGTESSGETRTILNDSGSSRLGDSGRFEHELVCWPSISDMVPTSSTPRVKSLEEIIQENCPAIVGTINIVNTGKSWEEDENQQQEITIIHSCTSEIAQNITGNLSSSSGDGPRSQDRDSESDRGTETESDVNSENYHARSEAESSILQEDDEDDVANDDEGPSQEDQFESMISNHVKGKFIRGVKKNTSTQTGKSMDSSRSTTASTSSSFDLEVVSKSKRFTTCTTQLSSGNSDYVVADRRRSYLPSGTSSLNLLNMKFSVGKEFESEVSICVPAKSHASDGKSFVARKTEKSHSQNISSCRDLGMSSRQREKVSQAELTTLWKDVKTRMDNKVGIGREGGKGSAEPELQIVGNGLRVSDSLGVLAVANTQEALSPSEGNNDKIKRSLQRLKKILDN